MYSRVLTGDEKFLRSWYPGFDPSVGAHLQYEAMGRMDPWEVSRVWFSYGPPSDHAITPTKVKL